MGVASPAPDVPWRVLPPYPPSGQGTRSREGPEPGLANVADSTRTTPPFGLAGEKERQALAAWGRPAGRGTRGGIGRSRAGGGLMGEGGQAERQRLRSTETTMPSTTARSPSMTS